MYGEKRVALIEIIDRTSGHAYRVWPDGTVEGFPANCIVFNRVPALVTSARVEALMAGSSQTAPATA